MRITQSDIARRANVSISTVSRVLNNHPYVDERTRALIQQTAAELRYPIEHLRGAPKQAEDTSADDMILLLHRSNYYLGKNTKPTGTDFEIIQGIYSVLSDLGLEPYLYHTQRTDVEKKDVELPRVPFRGMIVVGGIQSEAFIDVLCQQNKPFVMAGAHILPRQANCVMVDSLHGIQALVEHLVERGRRRIGMVGGPSTTSTSAEKYKAYRLGLAVHNLPYTPDQFISADFDAESAYQQTFTLLKRKPELDAIIYATDDTAIGGMRAIMETGRKVPDDIAVTGFNNYDNARFANPSLTTVESNMRMVGVLAAERLCQLLENPHDHRTWLSLVPSSIVIREST
ncbi:MAG: hypothetical protein CL610_29960 [Anaerolineaceae bacterium]|nr:hypothetical protein [Anaerolineaceae bacterium]